MNKPILAVTLAIIVGATGVVSEAFAQASVEFTQSIVAGELLANFQFNNLLRNLLTAGSVIVVSVVLVVFAGRALSRGSLTQALGLDKLSRFRKEKSNTGDSEQTTSKDTTKAGL